MEGAGTAVATENSPPAATADAKPSRPPSGRNKRRA
jgi:hypothetical protein